MKRVYFCSAADEQTGLKLCTGVEMDISFYTSGYPTEDFSGPGRKQDFACWIRKAFGGSWKDFALSKKQLSGRENQGTYSDQKVYVLLLNSIFSCTLSCLYAIIKAG